jgi:hypothetical protein
LVPQSPKKTTLPIRLIANAFCLCLKKSPKKTTLLLRLITSAFCLFLTQFICFSTTSVRRRDAATMSIETGKTSIDVAVIMKSRGTARTNVTKFVGKIEAVLKLSEYKSDFLLDNIEEEEAIDLVERLEKDFDHVKILHQRVQDYRVPDPNSAEETKKLEKEKTYIDDISDMA